MTEPGIVCTTTFTQPDKLDALDWLIVLNSDEPEGQLPNWARQLVGESSTLILSPRGSGPTAWTRKNPPNTVERSLALLGTTADAGRVWDVLTVAHRNAPKDGFRIAGRGNAGILAAYAALYEPSIREVVAFDPPASHAPTDKNATYGPPLLNVLRVLDIPEALGCLAPRRLTLNGARAKSFDRTAELYRIAGAEGRFTRK